MKRKFASIALALAALLTVGAAVIESASAQTTVATAPTVAQNLGQCNAQIGLPNGVSGCKFWTGNTICIDGSGINGAYYRVATLMQAWNNAVGSPNVFALDYSDDCIADGYPPSRRAVLGGYYGGQDGYCVNQTTWSRVPATEQPPFYWWTNGSPAVYINFDSSCVNSQAKRDHIVSAVIGSMMGLEYLPSGPSTRVMYLNGPVTTPDSASALLLYRIYVGYY